MNRDRRTKPANKMTSFSRVALGLIFSISFFSSGCSKQAFKVATDTVGTSKGGNVVIPPKVDILFVEDDTGSMFESFREISEQVPQFLSKIESQGWNYHFATTPLTTSRSLNQILTSKHDGNWALGGRNQWVSPFPGASPTDPGMSIPALFFTTPDYYSGFLTAGDISSLRNGHEPGFETIHEALFDEAPGTGFVRSDAILVVVVVSNGNDTSGVTFCTRAIDGIILPCEQINPSAGTGTSSFNFYKDEFSSLVTDGVTADMRFFAAVSPTNTTFSSSASCRGSNARVGTRYQQMAAALGGITVDFCSSPISSILDSVAQHLTSIQLRLQTRYLVLKQQPNTATIDIIKHPGGDPNNNVALVNGSTNGWTYGCDTCDSNGFGTVNTIDFPTPMNEATGYIIELHGSAKLRGNDTADISFQPSGTNPSSN